MNASKLVVAVLVGIAIAAGAIWMRRDDSSHALPGATDFRDLSSTPEPSNATHASTAAQATEALNAARRAEDAALPETGASAAPPVAAKPRDAAVNVTPADPMQARVAELKQLLAEMTYAQSGETFVDQLVAGGLARSDSESIVRNAFDGFAACALDAADREAREQSVPFEAVLDAIEATLSYSDGPTINAVIDVQAVRERALPCELEVRQQAGVPLPSNGSTAVR